MAVLFKVPAVLRKDPTSTLDTDTVHSFLSDKPLTKYIYLP